MLFNKKSNKCENCNSKIEGKFNFCPYCGLSVLDREKELRDFGMLGKSDTESINLDKQMSSGFGITDKIMNSLVNSLMKNLDRQFKEMDKEMGRNIEGAEIKNLPNGIKIKIGFPSEKPAKKQSSKIQKEITPEQMKKMSSLPRTTAKSSVKRLNDSLIYELNTPGVESAQDIFVSKIEEGYEIKAIGEKKIYVNSLPVDLPLRRLSLQKDKLLVEFKTNE